MRVQLFLGQTELVLRTTEITHTHTLNGSAHFACAQRDESASQAEKNK